MTIQAANLQHDEKDKVLAPVWGIIFSDPEDYFSSKSFLTPRDQGLMTLDNSSQQVTIPSQGYSLCLPREEGDC